MFDALQQPSRVIQGLGTGQLFALVLLGHVLLWTLLPSLLLNNASLDIIEALAWGHEWQLGYEKDPALWPWVTEAATAWSGKRLWTCYLASQLCIGVVFLGVWRLGCQIATRGQALMGVLLLEGIYYFNYPTPEFNDIVLQMPFAALFGWLLHRSLTSDRLVDWALAGVTAGLGLWARYSMGAYVAAMALFVLLHPMARKRLAGPGPWTLALSATLVFLPHMNWIVESGFISIDYVGRRAPASAEGATYFGSLLSFLGAQLAALIPMLALAALAWRWRSTEAPAPSSDLARFNQAYLAALALGPLAFSVALSVITQRPPRVMWAAPLMCFMGLFIAARIRPAWTPARLRVFGRAWLVVLLLPALLFTLEHLCRPWIPGKESRTQFPGAQLAAEVTGRWHAETGKPLKYVIGDTWHAGNAAFYSDHRPSAFFSHGGHRFSPWVTKEGLEHSGAALVWNARQDGPGIPPSLAAQFPDAVLQPGFSLNRNASVYEIGVAFLLPAE